MEIFLQKEPNISGADKIGAAISSSGISGRKITDISLFLIMTPFLLRFGGSLLGHHAKKHKLKSEKKHISPPHEELGLCWGYFMMLFLVSCKHVSMQILQDLCQCSLMITSQKF